MNRRIIGIDPGVNTGLAIYNPENKKFELHTKSFWLAFHIIKELYEHNTDYELVIYIEDSTQNRPVFEERITGKNIGTALKIAQYVGSNKRDCQLWFEFCEYANIEYYRIRPSGKSGTKIPKKNFEKITGYTGRSSQHSRDAAMMVVGRK